MGFKVPELTANSTAPLAEGKWEVKLVKFVGGESSKKKTPYVQVVWKLLDEDAVDTDDEPFTKPFYGDTFYLTEAAMWRIKKFASEAEVEIPEAGEEFDSVKDYAAALTKEFAGLEATVTTELEDYEKNDGSPGVKAVTVEHTF